MAEKKRSRKGEETSQQSASPPPLKDLRLVMKYLVISGRDEMKVSRSLEGRLEDLSMSGLIFQTSSMRVDDLHLSYDESPMIRNRLTVEIDIPGGGKVTTIGEVTWYERSLVSRDPVYHVGVTFREMSGDDDRILRDYLIATKRAVRAISLDGI